MSNNIVEIQDADLGTTFRLKIERDTYGDFIAIQDGSPLPPNRLGAQTWSQARAEARVILYAIRACMRSSQGLPYDLPEDLASLADEVIPEMAKGKIRIGKDEEDIPSLLNRLLTEMDIFFHQGVPKAARDGIYEGLRQAIPETVVELIRRGRKRRFDASGMRYGTFAARQDLIFHRGSTGEDMSVSAIIKLTTDDFEIRDWKLQVRIGPADEIKNAQEKMLTEFDEKIAAGEARIYRRLSDEQ